MKKILLSLSLLITLMLSLVPVNAYEETRLYDHADLLGPVSYDDINERLNEVSAEYDFDVIIVTEESIGNKTAEQYADDFFDEHYNAMGDGEDGILLLVSMEDREWAISTSGSGITYFTDAGQEYMVDEFKPYLSDGDYYEAFNTFIDLCDEYIEEARTNKLYDSSHMPDGQTNLLVWGIASVIGGFVIALIIMMTLRSQLKTVRFQPSASDYMHNMNLKNQQDIYLFKTVSRTKIERSSSGGSSTHMSSSGRTHGGSSGHF